MWSYLWTNRHCSALFILHFTFRSTHSAVCILPIVKNTGTYLNIRHCWFQLVPAFLRLAFYFTAGHLADMPTVELQTHLAWSVHGLVKVWKLYQGIIIMLKMCICLWLWLWLQGVDDAQGARLSQLEQEMYEVEVHAANVVSYQIN